MLSFFPSLPVRTAMALIQNSTRPRTCQLPRGAETGAIIPRLIGFVKPRGVLPQVDVCCPSGYDNADHKVERAE